MDLKRMKKTKWQLILLLILSESDTVHLYSNYRILATLSLSLFLNCRMTNFSRSSFFHTLATGHRRKLMFIMT